MCKKTQGNKELKQTALLLELPLGIVSAPVWTFIAGGVARLVIGVAAWNGVKRFMDNSDDDNSDTGTIDLLSKPDDNQLNLIFSISCPYFGIVSQGS